MNLLIEFLTYFGLACGVQNEPCVNIETGIRIEQPAAPQADDAKQRSGEASTPKPTDKEKQHGPS